MLQYLRQPGISKLLMAASGCTPRLRPTQLHACRAQQRKYAAGSLGPSAVRRRPGCATQQLLRTTDLALGRPRGHQQRRHVRQKKDLPLPTGRRGGGQRRAERLASGPEGTLRRYQRRHAPGRPAGGQGAGAARRHHVGVVAVVSIGGRAGRAHLLSNRPPSSTHSSGHRTSWR